MGWMKHNGKIWGDEPQDIMDDMLASKLGKQWYDKTIPIAKAQSVVKSIKSNKTLRAKIDKVYRDSWGRKATDAEFRGLIWGLSSLKKGKSL